jgi:hypothetical protein
MLWCVVRLSRNENVDLVINKHEHLVAYLYSIINVLANIVINSTHYEDLRSVINIITPRRTIQQTGLEDQIVSTDAILL